VPPITGIIAIAILVVVGAVIIVKLVLWGRKE
jgi:hypothetical protein